MESLTESLTESSDVSYGCDGEKKRRARGPREGEGVSSGIQDYVKR